VDHRAMNVVNKVEMKSQLSDSAADGLVITLTELLEPL
jgi:hypothetical protein